MKYCKKFTVEIVWRPKKRAYNVNEENQRVESNEMQEERNI